MNSLFVGYIYIYIGSGCPGHAPPVRGCACPDHTHNFSPPPPLSPSLPLLLLNHFVSTFLCPLTFPSILCLFCLSFLQSPYSSLYLSSPSCPSFPSLFFWLPFLLFYSFYASFDWRDQNSWHHLGVLWLCGGDTTIKRDKWARRFLRPQPHKITPKFLQWKSVMCALIQNERPQLRVTQKYF